MTSELSWRQIIARIFCVIHAITTACKPREALTLERGMGICRGHDPLFSGQSSRRSLAHQFTVNVPLSCPLFSIFRKFLHFQPCFGQNSSSLDQNFSKFSFPRPPFFNKNPLPRPYILKPVWHTPAKKKLSAPLGANTVCYHYHTDFNRFWLKKIYSSLVCHSQCLPFVIKWILRKKDSVSVRRNWLF